MMQTLRVTIDLDTDEIRDVLAFYTEGAHAVKDPTIRRYLLTIYDYGVPVERREAFRDAMRVSLRFCIEEVEFGRAGALRALLDGVPDADPPTI
ncbi:hypothetical protein [Microbacterium jejuense]|uniref:hypothetical protein n=1 Tax=Microbacterium jejuense TaxID=1263637 RepID=UPI0031F0703A